MGDSVSNLFMTQPKIYSTHLIATPTHNIIDNDIFRQNYIILNFSYNTYTKGKNLKLTL